MEYAECYTAIIPIVKEADTNITEEACAMIESDTVMIGRKTTVVFKPHWHKRCCGNCSQQAD